MCNVALSLALLIDVSGSVSVEQFDRVRAAHADAFQTPAIARSIVSNPIQVTVILYGTNAHVVIPWTPLSSHMEIASFSATLQGLERPERGTTNTASALRAALDALEAAPCPSDNYIIDLATDTDRDTPGSLQAQRERANSLGVTINVIMAAPAEAHIPSAIEYIHDNVITPTGFLIVVPHDDDYQTGLRRKLLLEIGYARSN